MAEKKKGGGTAARVREMAQPVADGLGLILWDVRFVKEGASWFLRLIIDKAGGVTTDDCADMSRAMDALLDETDPIQQSYYLEVSSPGLERELLRPEHFKAMKGRSVKLRLIQKRGDGRDFNGILKSHENGVTIIEPESGPEVSFNKNEIAWIKLDDFERTV